MRCDLQHRDIPTADLEWLSDRLRVCFESLKVCVQRVEERDCVCLNIGTAEKYNGAKQSKKQCCPSWYENFFHFFKMLVDVLGAVNVKEWKVSPNHTMNSAISRKQFLKVTALGAAAVALPVFGRTDRQTSKILSAVCIQPIPGKSYSRSFLRYCQRARFDSAAEALKQVKRRGVECRVVGTPT